MFKIGVCDLFLHGYKWHMLLHEVFLLYTAAFVLVIKWKSYRLNSSWRTHEFLLNSELSSFRDSVFLNYCLQ